MLLLTMVIAYIVPSFTIVMEFSGSFFLTVIGFIIPCYLYNIHFKDRIYNTVKYFNYLVIIVGIFFGLFGIIDSYNAMIQEFS